MFNLFKGKKKEFFLELDDSKTTPVKEAPKPAEAPKPEPVKVEAPKPAETQAAEPAPKAEAQPEVKTKKKSPRAKKQQAAPEPQPTPQSAPQPVAAVASSSNGMAQPEGSPNFATQYFMPMNTPRRRPGPSLNKYKDMANQMRKSKI